MNGHKDADGKFHPHNDTSNKLSSHQVESSKHGSVNHSDVDKLKQSKQTVEQRYSKEDIEGGESLFDNWISGSPQEWVQILGDEYPLSKKTRDNWWNHNSLGYCVWDDPEGRWSNEKSVVVLTDKDKDSLIRYWIDEKKDDELEDNRIRDRDDRYHKQARDEVGDALGTPIDEIHGSENAFQNFSISGWEGNHKVEVVVPFSVTPEQLKQVENKGWKVVSVGNGIKIEKEGFH
jgi:hypothetical protein